jgi:hypothetical protein
MPDVASKPLAPILGRSLLTAETIMAELRERLLSLPFIGVLSQEQLMEAARNILVEYEPLTVESLANADLAAWIAGFDRVAQKLPAETQFAPWWRRPPQEPPKFPPLIGSPEEPEEHLRLPLIEKAVASLFDRQILTPAEFNERSAEAKAKSFTVARESREDVLERIRDRLAETAREGASLPEFKARLGPELEQSFIGPAHVELVYRQGLQTAFSDGLDAVTNHPIVDEIFPYVAYDAIHDARARKEHIALETLGIDGTNVYRKDDREFWALFRPPWDYNCRCGRTPLTIEAAARRGVKEAAEWLRTGRRPPLEGRLQYIPFRPPAGFAKVAA